MNGEMIIIKAEGFSIPQTEKLKAPPSLETLQAIVGGLIEKVPEFDRVNVGGQTFKCVVYCNEEGKINNLKINLAASMYWHMVQQKIIDVLFGDVVTLIGDKEFMEAL
jgi:hypothetical protein